MVTVEITTNTLSALRMQMTRVPSLGEHVRVLGTVEGLTRCYYFLITQVVHCVITDAYPLRGVDAWLKGVEVEI